ncbi:MAG TPA: hypothetical protein VLU92_12020 [Candidatus Dormibacteraeota bacterium]|nr:hypothetical protein [Candidatus Dormibacteraeota bacterium]
MPQTKSRARKKPALEPDSIATLVMAWWTTVLAGEANEPHPIHRDGLVVRLDGGTLKLSGEVQTTRDRDELIKQARAQVGRGINEVDSSGLGVMAAKEKAGVLEQVLVAAFPNHATAELALKFVLERSRTVPKQQEVISSGESASGLKVVPEGFEAEVRAHLDKGRAVLVLRVDETEAYRVRGLLEEDTRSVWTVAAPPQVAAR